MNFIEDKQGKKLLIEYLKTFEGKSSLKVYRAEIKAFFRFFTGDISELSENDFLIYRDSLIPKGFTENTLKRKFSILNGFFRFLEQNMQGFESPIGKERGDLQQLNYSNYVESQSFKNLLSDFLSTLRSKETANQYKSQILMFFTWVGKKPDDLESNDFEEYRTELLDNSYMTATIINKFLSVKAFMRFYFKDPLKNPLNIKSLRLPSMPRGQGLANTLTESEIEQLLSQPDLSTSIGKRDHIMLSLMCRLGLRVSEVCNLLFRDIAERVTTEKGDSLKIWIHERKGNIKNTDIYLNRQVLESFDNWINNSGVAYDHDQPVFLPFRHHAKTGKIYLDHELMKKKKPLETETVAIRMGKYIEKSGIKSQGRVISPHALRHTAATNMFEKGIPLPLISHILGHTSIEITRQYINPKQSHLKNFGLLY